MTSKQPDEYKQMSKKDKLPLKYACVQPEVKESIASMSMPMLVKDHINDLYELINHQMLQQMRQEAQMIAVKHMEAWKRYDKTLDQYDPETRSYKK